MPDTDLVGCRGGEERKRAQVVRKGSWSKMKPRPVSSAILPCRSARSRLARGLCTTLALCLMLSVTHLVVVRSTMTRKLDLVLNVFETASYLPTLKGMHIPVNKEKALGLEVLEHSARAVEEGAYNEDRRGLRAPTSRRDGSSPYLTPEGRIRYDGEEEVPIGGHRQLWAMPMGSLVSSLGMEQHIKASHQGEGEAPKRPSQCGVLFRMNVTEDTAKSLDLDELDLELLGTIMVRLCDCKCVGEPPMKHALVVMGEILKGAHVVVEGDAGSFYSWFVHIQDSYRRVSSHFSMVPSYGVPEGSVLRTLLTGRTLKGDSWFQFEAAGWAPLSQPLESLMHAFNFLQYRVSGYQVGPLGHSQHTDRRPVRLRFDGCVDPRRRLFHTPEPSLHDNTPTRITLHRYGQRRT